MERINHAELNLCGSFPRKAMNNALKCQQFFMWCFQRRDKMNYFKFQWISCVHINSGYKAFPDPYIH